MERMGRQVIAGKRLLRQGPQTPLLPSVTQLVKGFQRPLLTAIPSNHSRSTSRPKPGASLGTR